MTKLQITEMLKDYADTDEFIFPVKNPCSVYQTPLNVFIEKEDVYWKEKRLEMLSFLQASNERDARWIKESQEAIAIANSKLAKRETKTWRNKLTKETLFSYEIGQRIARRMFEVNFYTNATWQEIRDKLS